MKKFLILLALIFVVNNYGQVRLPELISDGMILQRNTAVKIWGWASPEENISVNFADSTYNTSADKNGDWHIILAELNAGGPYDMRIAASNNITINDIMIGDVWVCSGQSNMELPVRRVSWVYPGIIADSQNDSIRQFYVPREYDFSGPRKDLSSGSWVKANPETVLDFSATAYFFGRELYKKYKVPIGLINSSLGGSPVEAWMSEEALKKFPEYLNEAEKFNDTTLIKEIQKNDQTRINKWYGELNSKDKGLNDTNGKWYNPHINTAGWSSMNIPGYWADTDLGPVNGVVWFRKKINLPASMAGKKGKLILGRIVDADSAYINGKYVGNVTYQYPPRRYDIPPGLLNEGDNVVTVRVVSNSGIGGFVPDKPYEIVTGKHTVDLKGEWKFKLGATMDPLASQTFIRWKPEGLYNAMLAPLLNYKIKGVIWYQGESNAGRPVEYGKLFPAMIKDWRSHWHQSELPFLFVQLPNFMEAKEKPDESNWALLRESQLKTLSLPNTGMAVAIDIGEWNDIHPLDKLDVGKRLALAAENVAYGENDIVYSGPVYKSMKIEGNKIILSFTHTGSGLKAKGGELKGFAIAGQDKNFVWANAKITDDKVIVWSDEVSNPVAVRYAWADNPDKANLYNKEGLPASPFRTDDF